MSIFEEPKWRDTLMLMRDLGRIADELLACPPGDEHRKLAPGLTGKLVEINRTLAPLADKYGGLT